jgi:hypothetical protein
LTRREKYSLGSRNLELRDLITWVPGQVACHLFPLQSCQPQTYVTPGYAQAWQQFHITTPTQYQVWGWGTFYSHLYPIPTNRWVTPLSTALL